MERLKELISEKVWLKNVIRHLNALKSDHPRGTYDVSGKMLMDILDKINDKIEGIENSRTILSGSIKYQPCNQAESLKSLAETRDYLERAENAYIAAGETLAEEYPQ